MSIRAFTGFFVVLVLITGILYGADSLIEPEAPAVHNIKHDGHVFTCVTYKESMQCFVKIAPVRAPTVEDSEEVISIQSSIPGLYSYTVRF